jgi:hypothetical protein
MSDSAFARSSAREAKIWKPFIYSFPFGDAQNTERIAVFGLYANAYLNGHAYLQAIEDTELANLLADYNNRIAELTAQERMVVADIVSKRYLTNIDQQIHNQKMTTMQARINMEDALANARYSALAADRAALETMAVKVSAEISKNAARITELEAAIETEGINLNQVEADISEKEIQSLRVDNQKLDTANEILKIQVQTVRTAAELLDIDIQAAKTKVDIAETQRAIAKIGLLADDLTIERAQTETMRAELPVWAARIELAGAKAADAEKELNYIASTLTAQEETAYDNKESLLNVKEVSRQNEITRKGDEQALNNENRLGESALSKTLADTNQAFQEKTDEEKVKGIYQPAYDTWRKVLAAVNAAAIVAGANVTTTLAHTVKKKA